MAEKKLYERKTLNCSRISWNLNQIRVGRGFTAKQLGKGLGISPGTIYSHESRGTPTDEMLMKYAKFYEVPAEDFFNLSPSQFKKKHLK